MRPMATNLQSSPSQKTCTISPGGAHTTFADGDVDVDFKNTTKFAVLVQRFSTSQNPGRGSVTLTLLGSIPENRKRALCDWVGTHDELSSIGVESVMLLPPAREIEDTVENVLSMAA